MMNRLLLLLLLLGSTPAISQAAQPLNILFIEVDDLTYKYIGAFGARKIQTPNMDRLAARGVLFENGIVQGCMCSPSRNSLITARYPQNLGLYSNGDIKQMPAETWAFPVALQEAGYHTSWIGKSHLLPWTDDQRGGGGEKKTAAMKQRLGFDEVWQSAGRHVALKKAQLLAEDPQAEWKSGIDAYADYLHEKNLLQTFITDKAGPTTLPVDDYLDGLIAKKSVDWIQRYREPKPFFLWVNFSGPHGPYNPPASYLDDYKPHQMPEAIKEKGHSNIPDCLRPHLWKKREEAIARQRAEYAGMITFMDEQVGRVIQAIEQKGLLKTTMIVFFSDHGIMEGDHGLMHKETLYKEVLNACLIIVDPNGDSGKRVSRPVELLDLAKTSLEVAGVSAKVTKQAYGESLLPLLRGRDADYQRKFAIAQIREATALVTPDYKYIQTTAGPVLFDLKNDPDELKNIAGSHTRLCREFQSTLDHWKQTHGPIIPPGPRVKNKGDE